jgi:uncharacterized protein YijF (DUF1287 family)
MREKYKNKWNINQSSNINTEYYRILNGILFFKRTQKKIRLGKIN